MVPFPCWGSFWLLSLGIFFCPLLSLFSFWHPIIRILVCFTLSQSSLRLSSFLFSLFSLFCSTSVTMSHLSSASLICSSASHILLLAASNEFFISYCILHLFLFKLYILYLFWSVFPVSYPSLPPVYFQCLASSSASTV